MRNIILFLCVVMHCIDIHKHNTRHLASGFSHFTVHAARLAHMLSLLFDPKYTGIVFIILIIDCGMTKKVLC
jgi:hypothetical protein